MMLTLNFDLHYFKNVFIKHLVGYGEMILIGW